MQRIEIAAAMILQEDRMLVVRKRGSDIFMQPGGKMEAGEAAADALVRELGEELAVAVSEEALEPLGVYSALAANEPDSQVVAHLFVTQMTERPQAQAEIAEVAWLALGEPANLPLAPLTADIVVPLARRRVALGNRP